MAFQGDYAYVGNYGGFSIYDIRNPKQPKVVSQVVCPGSQNDISVYGDLLFLSVDNSRSDDSCNSVAQRRDGQGVVGGHPDLRHQRQGQPQVHQVGRDRLRLAHPHAGARQGQGRRKVYLYVSSYSPNVDLPRLPAAARQDLHRQGAAAQADGRRRSSATPVLFPDGGNESQPACCADQRLPRHHRLPGEGPRGGRLHGRRRPAGHLRPGEPRRSPRGSRTRTSRSGTRRPSTTPAPRSSSPTSSAAAARPPATRRPARTGRGRHLRHQARPSSCSRATSRSRATRPTRRTASRTTAR